MAGEESEDKTLHEALTRAQLKKLDLEIENFQNRNKILERVVQLGPLLTAIVAVAGFLFTVNQFLVQQEKDRLTRAQEQTLREAAQLRTDLDQLLNTTDKTLAIARVLFLIDDMSRLIKRAPEENLKITSILTEFTRHDANFDNLKDIRFDIGLMKHWNSYQEYWRNNLEENNFIIYKYFQALRHVHDEDPEYFESIQHEEGFGYRVQRYTDESRYLRFVGLVEGFSLHLDIIKHNQRAAQNAIQRFQEAVNNSLLASQLFGALPIPRWAR